MIGLSGAVSFKLPPQHYRFGQGSKRNYRKIDKSAPG